jgi:hypothetical protein
MFSRIKIKNILDNYLLCSACKLKAIKYSLRVKRASSSVFK